jgi:hypothetical protein
LEVEVNDAVSSFESGHMGMENVLMKLSIEPDYNSVSQLLEMEQRRKETPINRQRTWSEKNKEEEAH